MREWYYNNYIQLYSWKEEDKILSHCYGVDYLAGNIFGYMPLLDVKDLRDTALYSRNDVIDYLKVDNTNKYAWYMLIDHFHIKNSPLYKKQHYIHDILLYHDNGSGFEYMEYVDGTYSSHTINYDDLSDAFLARKEKCLFRLNVNQNRSYKFSLCRYVEMIKDYIYSRNSLAHKDIYILMIPFFMIKYFIMLGT